MSAAPCQPNVRWPERTSLVLAAGSPRVFRAGDNVLTGLSGEAAFRAWTLP